MNKIALRINVCAVGWTAKSAIIASKVTKKIAIELSEFRETFKENSIDAYKSGG